jgi:hypothetical protein
VKLQMLIVPVVAAAALTSGCASWHAQDRGNDYQCGYSGSIEGALAGRQLRPGCGADYAGVDGDHLETIAGLSTENPGLATLDDGRFASVADDKA